MLEVVGRFARQVVPSVVATIIAALLISVLNYAFSQKIGTVKTNGIASLSGAPHAMTDFVFTEPQRLLEKTALIESPKEQMQPKAARPATVHRATREPDALEPARAALARTRPAAPASVEPPLQPPPVVTAPPIVTYQVVPPASAPPVAAAPAVDVAPRPPADIPQAAPTEFRAAQRNSLIGEIFGAIRPSAN
jgi:hypothetical protein